MTDRIDYKQRDIVVARFRYRHEAEFAAGFLDDAGIPYRLQVDDAAMGMTISTPATLWIRSLDLREALEVLDLPEPMTSVPPQVESSVASEPAWRSDVIRREAPGSPPTTALSAFERTVAATFSVGAGGLAALFFSGTAPGWWGVVMVVVAAAMASSALLGRAVAPIRSLLRAISGSAP